MTAPPVDRDGLLHEAVHACSIVADIMERHLLAHPAIANDVRYRAAAQTAADMVGALYQALGRELPSPHPPATNEDPSCPTRR